MRTAIIGAVLLVLGAAAVATGILPVPDALALWDRVWPILLFVAAITVVTELAAEAGLFTWVAQRTARWGRGRAWVLWLLVVLVAAACTVFLSLDTTAVLLTPVVIAMIVPMVAVFVVARRTLLVRYEPGEEEAVGDRVLFVSSAVVVVALVPLLVSGLPVWLPATAAAVVLGAVFLARRRSVLRF